MAEHPPLVRVAAALREIAAALDDLARQPAAVQPPASRRRPTKDRLRSVKTNEIALRNARAELAGSGLLPDPDEGRR